MFQTTSETNEKNYLKGERERYFAFDVLLWSEVV